MERTFWQIVKRFFEPALAHPVLYARSMFTASTYFLFDIYTILTLQKLASAFQADNVSDIPRILVIYMIVLGCMYIWKWSVKHSGWVTIKWFSPKYLFDKYFLKYIGLNNSDVERIGTGRLISIIKDGVFYQMDSLTNISYALVDLIIKVIFSVYLVSMMGRVYVLGFILFICLAFRLVGYVDSYANKRRKIRKENEEKFTRLFVRILHSKMEILSSDRIATEIGKNDVIRDDSQFYNKNVNKYMRWMFNIPLFLVACLTILIMYYSYTSYQNGTFDFGYFTGLVAMTGYLTQLMLMSTSKFRDLTKNYTHIERLRDFMDTTPKIQGLSTGSDFDYKDGSIYIKNLCFGYSGYDSVFKDFSLEIVGGKKTALVGVSGSGKSTLVKLIAGYLRPDSGKVVIDGQNLTEVSLKSYYQHIGYLTQEPMVFDGTVWENLTYALDTGDTNPPTSTPHVVESISLVREDQGLGSGVESNIGKEEIATSSVVSLHSAADSSQGRVVDEGLLQRVDEAIRHAKCEFIYDFPQGLQTEIGERGIRLSGGQRQRLAIAKIFLKDPEIIILDEPTAALDSFSEEAITEAMHNLFEGRTVIIIAHRLQTVKAADDIILIEDGVVRERGTHDDLVALQGEYAKMLELQSGF